MIKANQKHLRSKAPNIIKIIYEKYKKIENIEMDLVKIKSLIEMFPAL